VKKPDQFMPLDVRAYLGDTMHLSRDQHGAYMLLLMAYWMRGGPLVDNDRELAAIAKAHLPEWRKLRLAVAPFFQIKDGLWVHKRGEKELTRARDIIEAKTAAGSAGGIAARGKSGRKKNSKTIADEIAEPIANEWRENTPTQPPSQVFEPKVQTISPAASSKPPAGVGLTAFIELPTNRFETTGEQVPVYEPFIEEMQRLYPKVDVREQLRAMRGWLLTKERERKTKSGMKRFVNGWLARNQDKASSRETQGSGHGRSTQSRAQENLAIGAYLAATDDAA
jgi:uncharacterized protein YdaU (DUF1376 family)